MSCDVAKFTITKGLENTFVFTIKAEGSTLPMVMVGTDSFTADLIPLDPLDPAVAGTGFTGKVLVKDGTLASGKVTMTIADDAALSALVSDKGSKADRYYLRPNYKLVISCDTTNNGKFIAKVPEVYVD